ncbi:MAG: hypothetical protein SPL56_06415, partial [Lachnospiraceae bacterium]|nr:hypothetical protein [Lachnospiraceae bacterium]
QARTRGVASRFTVEESFPIVKLPHYDDHSKTHHLFGRLKSNIYNLAYTQKVPSTVATVMPVDGTA